MIKQEKLLESVVAITKQRDRDSLELSLGTTLIELVGCSDVLMLKTFNEFSIDEMEEVIHISVPNNQSHRDDYAISTTQQLVHPDAFITRCLNEKQLIKDAVDKSSVRIACPILLKDEVVGILSIVSDTFSETDTHLINGFVKIYQNYISILNDSEHDALTGLLNRKVFDAKIARIMKRYDNDRVAHQPLGSPAVNNRGEPKERSSHWLGIFDIDKFKRINDEFGHLYGDEVLLLLSQIMRKTFRADDLLFRYGGEEFIVVVAAADHEQAMNIFERFRIIVSEYNFPQVGRVTISTGVVEITPDDNPTVMVGHADQALYYAKNNGRNCSHSYATLLAEGKIVTVETEGSVVVF